MSVEDNVFVVEIPGIAIAIGTSIGSGSDCVGKAMFVSREIILLLQCVYGSHVRSKTHSKYTELDCHSTPTQYKSMECHRNGILQ